MPAPISSERREAILADLKAYDLTQKEIGAKHKAGLNTVRKIARAEGLSHSSRRATGEQHGSSKLNDDIVRSILSRVRTADHPNGETMTSLAVEYNVSIGMISAIASRKRRAHVETDEEAVRNSRVKRWREQLNSAQQATGKPLMHWVKVELELMEIPLPEDRWVIGLKGCMVIANIPPDGSRIMHASHVVTKINNTTQRHALLAVLGLPDETRAEIMVTSEERNAIIRAWAKTEGMEIGKTGTIPRAVVLAYGAAQEKKERRERGRVR